MGGRNPLLEEYITQRPKKAPFSEIRTFTDLVTMDTIARGHNKYTCKNSYCIYPLMHVYKDLLVSILRNIHPKFSTIVPV